MQAKQFQPLHTPGALPSKPCSRYLKTPEISMKIILYCITIVAITVATGCAANRSKPIIDPDSVDMELYQYDLAECEQIAEQVDQKAGSGAVSGAVVGGLIGAIVGDGDSVTRSAGVGGVLGGAKGAGATERERSQVVKNCLRNRGYNILN
jgi:outer membrane lipoprotein SlyB